MIHHPVVLCTKFVVLLIIIIVLVILKGVLSPAHYKWAVGAACGIFIVSMPVIWFVFGKMIENPNSRLGKHAVILPPKTDGKDEQKEELLKLVGREGYADTILRPSGMGMFDNECIQVIADGKYVEKGTKIKVTEIVGKKVKVKKV
jgi:membrane-bound ClpP family serine protease